MRTRSGVMSIPLSRRDSKGVGEMLLGLITTVSGSRVPIGAGGSDCGRSMNSQRKVQL
jgi:hypothetical protein